MTQKYQDFMIHHKATKGQEITHTRIGDKTLNIYGGSYHISSVDLPTFYDLYYDYVFEENKKEYLTEKQTENILLVDFDFRYNETVKSRQHTEDSISEVVVKYLELIQSYYIIPPRQVLDVYVLEKPNVNIVDDKGKKLTKDGIHIIIGLKVERKVQESIRNEMIAILPTTDWKHLPLTNTWEDVLDAGITKGSTNISLIGSRKPGHEAYDLSYQYRCEYNDSAGEFEIEKVDCSEYEPFPKLSVQCKEYPSLEKRQHHITTTATTNVEQMVKISASTVLPTNDEALSYTSEGDTDIEIYHVPPSNKQFHKLEYFINNGFNNGNFDHLEMCKIGYALNSDFGKKGLSLYLKIAEKYSDCYDKNEYTKKYNEYLVPTKQNITLASIFYIFKKVNKPLYDKLSTNYKLVCSQKTKQKETLEGDDLILFEQYKAEFEKEFFKLNNPLCYVRELNNKLQFLSTTDLKEYLKSSHYNFKTEQKSFYNEWTNCSTIRLKEEIVFDPSLKQDEQYYNLFKGFKYDDSSIEDLNEKDSNVIQLINHLCLNEAEYFKDWISKIVQTPNKKTEWAVVLYSEVGGVGKNCITDFLVELFGIYAGLINNIEDITKTFNSDLCNKLFIYGDEINASAKKVADELKKVITRKEATLEKKGFDPIKVNDFSNYLFTTNNEHCFKIDVEDRRYLMIRCTNERKSDAFYKAFHEEIQDANKMKQLFKYFKTREIKYKLNKAPASEYKRELIVEQKPAYIQMLYNKTSLFANTTLSSTKLYELSKQYAKKTYLSSNYTVTKFGTDVKLIIGQFYKRTSGGRVYEFPNVEELSKALYDYDQDFYRYVKGFDKTEEVIFQKVDARDSQIDVDNVFF